MEKDKSKNLASNQVNDA
jgi:hypothetical protein